ncbi:MAG: chemotaxis response regulator protein-glutamate methylesterase [Chelatococcus sp.]|uniref:chemotaxis protein CheB n=1 Tax=unclassified Chelatococcus TaxID=2638111 RepID=UPI001BD0C266|nr:MULTISPECIES: chemotaxis protein CheB [unclassified Chelatococcus]MBS7741130.1 chemotaxis response regulator protein-glutamate methylesterase [Chelatococcus sp. HY11]MBX3539864.1 chemotaxis response regulator protein-glutamate methylesterase [Chelatococcus sp.]MBX3545316.1 chemotaxis response regulator protein-glutamate methylesterase [Chelatococcus sp.]MCO5077949.1 chemotaxis response regulator protein-glutamate methylesterase [Chelatococcus sp.]
MVIGATSMFDEAAIGHLRQAVNVVAHFPTISGVLDELNVLDPHVVLLDVTAGTFDGMAALQLILAVKPAVAIIVMVGEAPQSADLSLRCLSRGAAAGIMLPARARGRPVRETRDCFVRALIGKIRTVAARPQERTRMVIPGLRRAEPSSTQPRCIIISASTGGPQALAIVMRELGPALVRSVPIIILQHMPTILIAGLASQIGALCGCRAAEVADGEHIRAGAVYVAPGHRHLRLRKAGRSVVAWLDDGPPVNSCKPSADLLLGDAAEVYGCAILSIILTGMGQDGLRGATALSAVGAPILVQDEATSTVWGMPGSVARAGLASAVVPLDQMAATAKTYWPDMLRHD